MKRSPNWRVRLSTRKPKRPESAPTFRRCLATGIASPWPLLFERCVPMHVTVDFRPSSKSSKIARIDGRDKGSAAISLAAAGNRKNCRVPHAIGCG